MTSRRRDKDNRKERKERREERQRVDQGVSPSRFTSVERKPATVREAARQERVGQSRLNSLFRGPVVPDYKSRVTDKVRDTYIPQIHPMALEVAFKPSTVIQTPKKEARQSTLSLKKEDHVSSPSARDDHKNIDVCKKRPDKLTPRRAGGGASKKFVPWCK